MCMPSCALGGMLWPALQPHSGRSSAAAQEAAALAEAQAGNQSLRTQLVEATSAFHHALSIAQTLLTEGAACLAIWSGSDLRGRLHACCVLFHNNADVKALAACALAACSPQQHVCQERKAPTCSICVPCRAAEELTGLAEEDEVDEHAWTEDDAGADIEPDPPGAVLDARRDVTAADVTEHAAELGASSPS